VRFVFADPIKALTDTKKYIFLNKKTRIKNIFSTDVEMKFWCPDMA